MYSTLGCTQTAYSPKYSCKWHTSCINRTKEIFHVTQIFATWISYNRIFFGTPIFTNHPYKYRLYDETEVYMGFRTLQKPEAIDVPSAQRKGVYSGYPVDRKWQVMSRQTWPLHRVKRTSKQMPHNLLYTHIQGICHACMCNNAGM